MKRGPGMAEQRPAQGTNHNLACYCYVLGMAPRKHCKEVASPRSGALNTESGFTGVG